MTLIAFSYLLLWARRGVQPPLALHIAALVVGVLVLDVGMQMAQVANQTRIFGLVSSARSRLNTVYMTASSPAGRSDRRSQPWPGTLAVERRLPARSGTDRSGPPLPRARHAHREPFNPTRAENTPSDSVLEV